MKRFTTTLLIVNIVLVIGLIITLLYWIYDDENSSVKIEKEDTIESSRIVNERSWNEKEIVFDEKIMTRDYFVTMLDSAYNNPDMADSLLEEMSFAVDYISCEYMDLCFYAAKAYEYGFDSLNFYFEDLVEDKKNQIISEIGNLSIKGVASVYRNSSSEWPFLDEYLEECIVDGLDSLPYNTVKMIHEQFKGTNISPDIDTVFYIMRDSVIRFAIEDIEEFLELEECGIDYVEEQIVYSMNCFVDTALAQIMQQGMERSGESLIKTLKRIRRQNKNLSEESVREDYLKSKEESTKNMCYYFSNLCAKYLRMEAIKDTIAFYLDNYIAEENKSRRELIKCWTEISEFPDYLVMPPYENLFTDDAVVLMNEEMIREIAMNKYNSRIQDGIWNAIGFVPLVGDILTIPDLIWNIHRGKEESEEQQLIMYDFCEDLRDEAINTYMTIIEEVCSQYCSLIENDINSLVEYVKENI